MKKASIRSEAPPLFLYIPPTRKYNAKINSASAQHDTTSSTSKYALSSQSRRCNKLLAPIKSQEPERLTFQKNQINHLLNLFGESEYKTTGNGSPSSDGYRKVSGVDVTSPTSARATKSHGAKNKCGTGRSINQQESQTGEKISTNYQYDEYGIRYAPAYYRGLSQKRVASPVQVEEFTGSSGPTSRVASSSSSPVESSVPSVSAVDSKSVASRSNKSKRVKVSIDNGGVGAVAGGIEHDNER
ncbi:hypothetical protein HDU76_006271, partial [Blyttiomyces sp. JEL0837]